MLAETTRDVIQRWVARRLDCATDDLRSGGALVKPHGPALADYQGIYVWLTHDRSAIVSAPAGWLDVARQAVAGQPITVLVDAAFWLAALGDGAERVVGPSYQGFLDASAFHPAATQGARPLTPADRPALERFTAACPPDAWEDSAISFDHQPIFGLEREGVFVALASAPLDAPADEPMAGSPLRSVVRSVGVVTLPAWRGRGAGRAVVSALTAHCLTSGATLHYQTLRANVASVAIARTLGYVDMATAFAVRLRTPAAHG